MIKATGDKEIDAVLRGLPLLLSDRLLSNSFTDAAKPMVEAIKRFTPTGETDNLINSIGIVKERNIIDGKALGQIQIGPRRKGKYKGWHGHLLEYGHKSRKKEGGKGKDFVPAHPFMEPGSDQTREVVLARINTSIGTKVTQFIKRTVKQ